MTSDSVAILALARNCAGTIPTFLRWVESLNAAGMAASVIVGENDSRDDSRRLLLAAERTGLLRLEPTDFMRDSPRLRRMAEGRQHLAACLAASPATPAIVCVLDIDEPISSPPDLGAFKGAIARLASADGPFAVSATSRPAYYDLLAFDDGSTRFDDLLDVIKVHEADPWRYFRFFRETIYPAQERLTSEVEIDCLSAFNGMCLYRAEDFRRGSYVAGSDFRICEHLTFNRSVAAATGRRMVISPGLRVRTPTEHGRRSFFGFWQQRVKKLGPRVTAAWARGARTGIVGRQVQR